MSERDVQSARRDEDPPGGWLHNPWLGGVLPLVLLFGVFTWASWRRWVDPVVDFGQYLYVPWRLTLGEVLDKDIWYSYGPLTHRFTQGLFQLFGTSFLTLALANVLLAILTTVMIHRIFARIFGHRPATLAAGVFIALFCFAHYNYSSNFNYITPYNLESHFGGVLCVTMIWAMGHSLQKGRWWWHGAVGLSFGLMSMTRLQILYPGLAVLAAYVFLAGLGRSVFPGRFSTRVAMVAAGALVPVLLASWLLGDFALSYLTDEFSFIRATVHTLNGKQGSTGFQAGDHFYAHVTGLDDPSGNLSLMLQSLGAYGVVVGVALLGAYLRQRFSSSRSSHSIMPLFLIGLLVATPLFLFNPPGVSGWVSRSLPLLVFGIFGWMIKAWFTPRQDGSDRISLAMGILWGVYALALMAKVALNVTFFHYGFFHAMPATLLTTAFLVGGLPRSLHAWPVHRPFLQTAMTWTILLVMVWHGTLSLLTYGKKSYPLGKGDDLFYTFRPPYADWGPVIEAYLTWAESHIPPSATVTALPEGVMLDYLARRKNGIPFFDTLYLNAIFWGSERNIRHFKEYNPDFFILVDRSTREYGLPPFGSSADFGRKELQWIGQHYEKVALFGQPPLTNQGFGIMVLQRRRGAAATVE
ncbi:MAG: glycosyltransferase family 39 protein [Magnetococcales bacterium]|nr:glycosyltransferase family 39 protein [Magnetococcales bacterium]